MIRLAAFAVVVCATLAGFAGAQPPATPVKLIAPPNPAVPATGGSHPPLAKTVAPAFPKPIDPADVRALEATVRDLLLKHLPDPIVQSAPHWGEQKECTAGVKFHRDGLRMWSEPVKAMKNDGTWRRMSVRAADPAKTLAVGIKDAVAHEPGRATFTAMIGVDTALTFEQQLWQNGHRLYSGETRGHCRAALSLTCEITNRVEPKPGSLIPDVVFRVRATDAQLFYENLVIDHTAGIGGDGAKLLGDAVIHAVKKWKPDLEHDLLAKANTAVVRAADTKDVRVSLDAMLKGHMPSVTRK